MLQPPKDAHMLEFVGGALAVPVLLVYLLVVVVALGGLIWLILRRSNDRQEPANPVGYSVNSDVGD